MRPAFYALPRGGWRDYVTLLHPPYTLWHLAYVTIGARRRGVGDASPGCIIFNRFMERVSQRVTYADELLKHEKFTFEGDERVLINRKELPYPADLDEAKKLVAFIIAPANLVSP